MKSSFILRRGIQGLTAALIVFGGVLIPAGGAEAAVPDHGSYSFTDKFVDSEVCAAEGFDVSAVESQSGHFEVFFNADGSFKDALVHQTAFFTISANGHTINESDHWQTIYYADGSSRQVGLTVHIQGPGGIVQLDAGQIAFNPDGSVAYVRGPHPQFEGQTFCFALLP
jgi:hypothetical protein